MWNDVKLGLPTIEGTYLVYKEYPYLDKFEVCTEKFLSRSKVEYNTDNKKIMYKKWKFKKTGDEPQIVRAWMFLPQAPAY